jgi:hypothetical protein
MCHVRNARKSHKCTHTHTCTFWCRALESAVSQHVQLMQSAKSCTAHVCASLHVRAYHLDAWLALLLREGVEKLQSVIRLEVVRTYTAGIVWFDHSLAYGRRISRGRTLHCGEFWRERRLGSNTESLQLGGHAFDTDEGHLVRFGYLFCVFEFVCACVRRM